MAFSIRKVQVWTGHISDRPGAAAAKLELLARAGADLEFIFTRPARDKPETGTIYLAPLKTPPELEAARMADLVQARDVAMLCVEGANRPGIGYAIMSRLAVAGINLHGLSVSVLGDRFAAYLLLGSPDAAAMAVQVLAGLND